MKLTDQAIEAINTKATRLKIALLLNVGENTVRLHINENKDEGDLTKAGVLKLIKEETGLSQSEILTEETHA